MPAKKYKCTNYAACDKAISGEIIELEDGCEPECEHAGCRKFLMPADRPTTGWLVKVAAAVLVLTGGAALTFALWPKAKPAAGPVMPVVVTPQSDAKPCDVAAMERAYKAGDCDAVVKAGNDCLRRLPDDATTLNNVAACLLKKNDPSRAGDLLSRALNLKPNDPYLHYNLACALARGRKPDDAIDQLRRACQLGLAPANFRQDPDLASLSAYTPFVKLVSTKDCQSLGR